MFAFTSLKSLATLAILRLAAATTFASSPAITARQINPDTFITVCTAPNVCSSVSGDTSSDGCTDLLDHYGYLYKEIISATIPEGFTCFFFEDFECNTTGDSIFLETGTWDFSTVTTTDGVTGFDGQTASLTCVIVPLTIR